jgi:hypothetical protein
MKRRVIPYELDRPDPNIVQVENAFKSVFKDTLSVTTLNVKGGKTSSVIYVPKEFRDKVATVIIWDRPVKYYEDLLRGKNGN